MNAPLPYVDMILGQLARGDAEFAAAFGRHIHWGYWPDPQAADGSVADFARAAERMTRYMVEAANIQAGQHVLDVGCGFGGTVACLNESWDGLKLTGLNIDGRQLERARREVQPRGANQIDFVEGDACRLPFEAESFDRVLAVECVFHFPSRREFLREAARVLRPGGRLTVSDFVAGPSGQSLGWMLLAGIMSMPAVLVPYLLPNLAEDTWGSSTAQSLGKYRDLAEGSGFKLVAHEDITSFTLPTYPVVTRLLGRLSLDAAIGTQVAEAEAVHRTRRYTVLQLVKQEPVLGST